MRYFGIDPGSRITGYACVEGTGGVHGGEITLVEAGTFRLDTRAPLEARLVELERDLSESIERLAPHVGAVEKLYSHYRHPTTAIVMGHARGVVLLAMARAELPISELTATEVKKSLTGHGHASKTQMQDAVQAQLGLAVRPEPADVADAIAVALCAARRGFGEPDVIGRLPASARATRE